MTQNTDGFGPADLLLEMLDDNLPEHASPEDIQTLPPALVVQALRTQGVDPTMPPETKILLNQSYGPADYLLSCLDDDPCEVTKMDPESVKAKLGPDALTLQNNVAAIRNLVGHTVPSKVASEDTQKYSMGALPSAGSHANEAKEQPKSIGTPGRGALMRSPWLAAASILLCAALGSGVTIFVQMAMKNTVTAELESDTNQRVADLSKQVENLKASMNMDQKIAHEAAIKELSEAVLNLSESVNRLAALRQKSDPPSGGFLPMSSATLVSRETHKAMLNDFNAIQKRIQNAVQMVSLECGRTDLSFLQKSESPWFIAELGSRAGKGENAFSWRVLDKSTICQPISIWENDDNFRNNIRSLKLD